MIKRGVVVNMGPGHYFLGAEEKNALCKAIDNKNVSRYRQDDLSNVDKFEKKTSDLLNVKYTLGMNSCTSALFTGIKYSGINPGDEVIVPGYTFVATIAAVVLNGAIPVFANVDESFSIDPEDIEKRITSKTKAIIAVHMLGNPCDMNKLSYLCKKYNLILIEDVAQALGGSYENQMLGSFGLFGAFSLNCFKIITAGDGGFLTTNNDELYHKVFSFHDHGFYESNNRVITENSCFGLNLRMHELTGCVAYEQLNKIDFILRELRKRKRIFKECLGENSKFVYRKLNDINGDCGNVTVITFDNINLSNKFCDYFKTKNMAQSSKHCYSSMVPILKKEILDYNYNYSYMKNTEDLLSRSVILSAGMTDDYIGSTIGYSMSDSESQIINKADEIRKYIEKM